MGACYGRQRRQEEQLRERNAAFACVKSQPLKTDVIRWKSEMPITRGQLKSQQDAFWETCVVFDGRKEIWDAIKAAVAATEECEFDLAQAIVDGANIFTPHGNLTEAYDELGNQYKVPIFCLSLPVNILCEDCDEGPSVQKRAEEDPAKYEVQCENDLLLKLRLSATSRDVELRVRAEDTISSGKVKLGWKTGYEGRQRWFYGGKLLEDKLKIAAIGVPSGHIIQVVFIEAQLPPPPPTSS